MTARFSAPGQTPSRLQFGKLTNKIQLIAHCLGNLTRTVIPRRNRPIDLEEQLEIISFSLVPPCHTTLCNRMALEFDEGFSLPN